MWYNEIYFNRRDWLVTYFHKLDISSNELLVLLIIDGANQSKREITYELLKEYTKLSQSQIDKIIASLTKKNYLKIKSVRRRVDFNIDGIFRKEFEESAEEPELLKMVEEAFGRLLSQQELKTLASLKDKVETEKIVYAIRQAVIYNKMSMSYLEKVALNEDQD